MKADDLLPKIASIVLAGGAFLCIFVLLYFIYYYGWTAQRRFSALFGMVLYYVFPAVLASLLFAFLRRSPEFKVNAAILCLSLAVSAYAGELFLRLIDSTLLRTRKTCYESLITIERKERRSRKTG